MKFSILASGSKGNACYIETDNTRLLIDAGISCLQIEKRLERIGKKANDLDAILVTHEHIDHIRGVGPLSRRYNIPLYLNQKTYENGIKTFGNVFCPVIIQTGSFLYINDLRIETFTKCHDAADPLGLKVSFNGISLGIATDLGRSTKLVEDRLRGCHALIIEFNHDQEMLDEGPYPLELIRRIKGQDGHLSNRQARSLLEEIISNMTRYVVLAHLSDTNNNPDKAYFEATSALKKNGQKNTSVIIGLQDEPGPLLDIII
ncbi:MBL fold metallo-hydrolase [Thermodesulfobacteriota bacterium]